jgi:hemerythrin-like domain-containing protein
MSKSLSGVEFDEIRSILKDLQRRVTRLENKDKDKFEDYRDLKEKYGEEGLYLIVPKAEKPVPFPDDK